VVLKRQGNEQRIEDVNIVVFQAGADTPPAMSRRAARRMLNLTADMHSQSQR
jgi:malate/lactate dehydrogenase